MTLLSFERYSHSLYIPLIMETCRTFSNVLENFQKKRKNFVANLILQKLLCSTIVIRATQPVVDG